MPTVPGHHPSQCERNAQDEKSFQSLQFTPAAPKVGEREVIRNIALSDISLVAIIKKCNIV